MRDQSDTQSEIIPPNERSSVIGHESVLQRMQNMLEGDNLTNGWMLCGPKGIGKATLAYHLAKQILSNDPSDIEKTDRLVSQKAHPDLFIAERLWDEKKQKFANEISVDTIRKMSNAFATKADHGKRLAIIDTADELNRNAANALLKILEEPPEGAIIFLLVEAPGRILPTIRSRCRSISLSPVNDHQITSFLNSEIEISPSDSHAVTLVAGGRPGYALELAAGDGKTAIDLVSKYLKNFHKPDTVQSIAATLQPKAADNVWRYFRVTLEQQISNLIREKAMGQQSIEAALFPNASTNLALKAWEELKQIFSDGERLNTDRSQIITLSAIRMKSILVGKR